MSKFEIASKMMELYVKGVPVFLTPEGEDFLSAMTISEIQEEHTQQISAQGA